jgi:HEAT repeat protein
MRPLLNSGTLGGEKLSQIQASMPTVAEWRSYLYSSRRDFQLRAARALLERAGSVELADLLYILDEFALQGLGAAARRALLERAGLQLVEPMRLRLGSPERFLREAACDILGSCRDFSATPHLVAALRDPEMMVRRAAGFALAALKDPASLPELRAAAALAVSDDTNVRWAIDAAIRALEPPEATPA